MNRLTRECDRKNTLVSERMDLIKQNYLIERELSDRLRNSSADERKILYTTLYDEYHKRAPYHPSKAREKDTHTLQRRMRLLNKFITPDMTFLEVGPGNGQVCLAVAEQVQQTIAVDVSKEITKHINPPDNFRLVISNGSSIDVESGSVDLVYSNQLMEHLHPDDAEQQLENIYIALKPGGKYICITPNAINGPHDISKYFDNVARGFHLKEYTIDELTKLFRYAGFRKVRYLWVPKGHVFIVWPFLLIILERFLSLIPNKLLKRIVQNRLLASMLDVRVLGVK